MKLRFAPSPTGLLHVGNLRAALANWLVARRNGGAFILRLDDTDLERSKPEYAAAIEEDLRWLGLDWDERVSQSDRLDHYAAAAERLKASGRLYPCFETEEELAYLRDHTGIIYGQGYLFSKPILLRTLDGACGTPASRPVAPPRTSEARRA